MNKAQAVCRILALSLGLFFLTACQAADTGKPPVDPEKTPLDLGTIFLHVQEIMNLKEEADQVFVRWEGPVRYYLQGLEKHPELEKLFEEQIQEIARITGLDIKRHDGLYLEYKDPLKRQVGPDGLSTNVAIFFAEDMQRAFETEKVVRILTGFGDNPKEKYQLWKEFNDKNDEPDLSYERSGWDSDGMKFFFILADAGFLINESGRINVSHDFAEIVISIFFRLEKNLNEKKYLASILSNQSYLKGNRGITEFDEKFLKVYYGETIKSGITKRNAALNITEILAKEFMQKRQ